MLAFAQGQVAGGRFIWADFGGGVPTKARLDLPMELFSKPLAAGES